MMKDNIGLQQSDLIEVLSYDPGKKSVWDSVVHSSKTGNFLHLRDYLEYHQDRFEDASILINYKKKTIAVFPCSTHGDSVVSHGGLTYGGLLYGREVRAHLVIEMLVAVTSHYKRKGAARLVYKVVPNCFHKYPAEEDQYALFRMGAKLVRRDLSSVIEMSKRPRFAESRRSGVRKAVNAGITLQEGINVGDLYVLLSSVVDKFGVRPTHSASELELLMARFPTEIRSFGALRADGTLLATAVVYDFGDCVHTQYLASSEEGRATGALDYLVFNLVESSFKDKRMFSFGTSTEKAGHILNEGLIFQKEAFGGRGIVHDFYELDLINANLP
jgi:hypothetical protein